MVGDTLITGSDDWTARVWSVSRGACDAVLACHAGAIQAVEYSPLDRGIITGWHLIFCRLAVMHMISSQLRIYLFNP